MRLFDDLYLSWRKGKGYRRYIIGKIEHISAEDTYQFSYIESAVKQAITDGFTPYTEFIDTSKTYKGQHVLDIFSQRLINPERPDIEDFYKFWEIDKEHISDKFYLLGKTQGLLPTDNFEFLADYKIENDLSFLTELAGLSKKTIQKNELNHTKQLRVDRESDNLYDKDAVAVYSDLIKIGYIKKIHCKVFSKPGSERLKITLKAVESINNLISRIFIKVEYV